MGNTRHPLRRIRSAAGLSQRELSRRSGVTHASISWYEGRLREPRRDSLIKLADVLGCEPHELVEWDREIAV
jgi:transcriptional regulator with XRE-family HTH domain